MGKSKTKDLGNLLRKDKNKKLLVMKDYFKAHGEEKKEVDYKKKLESCLVRDTIGDFLYDAELKQEQFDGVRNQKLIIKDEKIINKEKGLVKDSKFESAKIQLIRIPRKPDWKGKTNEQQKNDENLSYLAWKKQLAQVAEMNPGVVVTPYEKNIEVWKQLWHVVETCDLLFQIVDARDNGFFRCEDLEKYVKEVDPVKENFLILNKSDLVPEKIRKFISNELISRNINHVFFSAKTELEKEELDTQQKNDNEFDKTDKEISFVESDFINTAKILNKSELLMLMNSFRKKLNKEELIKIGMVGFPNVGKSSLINSIYGQKKVGVTSKPGKTKNYQTLFFGKHVLLCDCPGLVFPSVVNSRSDLICNGIISHQEVLEYLDPVMKILSNVPLEVLAVIYKLPLKLFYEKREKSTSFESKVSAREFLQIHAGTRGFVTGSGTPDEFKSAKLVIKDYVDGKIPHFQIANEELKKEIYAEFVTHHETSSHNMNIKNVKQEDLLIMSGKDTDYMTEVVKGIRNNQCKLEDSFLEELTEERILNLLEGKVVTGVRLTKDQRRELKFAIKSKDSGDSIISLIRSFLKEMKLN